MNSFVSERKAAKDVNDWAALNGFAGLVLERAICSAVAPFAGDKMAVRVDFGGTPRLTVQRGCTSIVNLKIVRNILLLKCR